MSAAAFIKGLLDLEGSSLTPILVSLVTKNASMLDAFGKVSPRQAARHRAVARLASAAYASRLHLCEECGPALHAGDIPHFAGMS